MRRWATITEIETTLTRERVLEANDLLDALDEADEIQRARTEAKTETPRRK